MRFTTLTAFRGPAGDHNDRAMDAVIEVSHALARHLSLIPTVVGTPSQAEPKNWDDELERARPALEELRDVVTGQRGVPAVALTRCAAALATVPAVLRDRPDAVIVWFDAHGDSHTPDTTTGFLGGMALAGARGWWETGLGACPDGVDAVIVGGRDLEEAELQAIETGRLHLVAPGENLAARLDDVVQQRPVFVHLDCDVLEPGIVATDYRSFGGLNLDDIYACARVLAASEVLGLQIAEFEGPQAATADALVDALMPLWSQRG